MNEESERAKRHQGEMMAGLVKQEGFKVLERVLRKKEERMGFSYWSAWMGPEPPPDMPQQAAYLRGFFDGMRYAVAVPKGAEKEVLKTSGEENEEVFDRWSSWAPR